MKINELTSKFLTGFDALSDDDKAKALLKLSLHALPLKGSIIMPFLHVLMDELLPLATADIAFKDTPPEVTFSAEVHKLGHFLLKNVLESAPKSPRYHTLATAHALKTLSPGDKNEIH